MYQSVLSATVWVAALGYFVDIFDLFLFSVIRVSSVRSLNVPEAEMFQTGIFLLNCQMAGLLLGSLLFGVWGDKKGRLKILYGSIFLYSLATLLNAFVVDVTQYAWLRFSAGMGLAGELGAAVTLVSENLSKENRGVGTTLVASVGFLGGIFAAWAGEALPWRACFILGGVLGFVLLGLRFSLQESLLFEQIKDRADLGKIAWLFNPRRLWELLKIVVVGTPIWFVSGILIVFSPEFGKALSVHEPVLASRAVFYSYLGLIVGDLVFGVLSQWLKSRKKSITVALFCLMLSSGIYLHTTNISSSTFYGICFMVGFFTGYWIVTMTLAAEYFGTNLRATTATLVPNLIRASVIPMTIGFGFLKSSFGLIDAAMIIGSAVIALAMISLLLLKETFARDLNFLEKL